MTRLWNRLKKLEANTTSDAEWSEYLHARSLWDLACQNAIIDGRSEPLAPVPPPGACPERLARQYENPKSMAMWREALRSANWAETREELDNLGLGPAA